MNDLAAILNQLFLRISSTEGLHSLRKSHQTRDSAGLASSLIGSSVIAGTSSFFQNGAIAGSS